MSPDIEWRVGEDAEQETIVRTSNVRRSRRGRWVVLIAIGLGVGLGLLYRSIPNPPKPIDPAPIPTVIESPLSPLPTPESLEAAIERDAQRLASLSTTDGVTFDPSLSRMPQAYADWYAALQNVTGSWGPITPQTPYAIFETGALPDGIVWMNLRQFRNGDFFRHMRFYRRQNDRWIWVLPDAAFWSGKTAVVTTGDAGTIGPITIGHPIEDAPVIGAVFDRFAHAYQDLCESLKCPPPIDRTHLWTPGLTLSITIQPLLMQPLVQDHLGLLQIDLPSPQVVGYYENVNTPGDPYDAMAYATLIAPVARLASGDYARWESDHGGELFLQAIVVWEQTHLAEEIQPLSLFYPTTFSPPAVPQIISWQPSVTLRKYYSDLLRDEFPLPLGSLWGWFGQGDRVGSLQHVAINEAEAAVAFIDERYGEEYVVRFLNALGRAHSLDEALGAALSVSFEEFNREWAKWIAGE